VSPVPESLSRARAHRRTRKHTISHARTYPARVLVLFLLHLYVLLLLLLLLRVLIPLLLILNQKT